MSRLQRTLQRFTPTSLLRRAGENTGRLSNPGRKRALLAIFRLHTQPWPRGFGSRDHISAQKYPVGRSKSVEVPLRSFIYLLPRAILALVQVVYLFSRAKTSYRISSRLPANRAVSLSRGENIAMRLNLPNLVAISTCYFVLGLISSTQAGAEALEELDWEVGTTPLGAPTGLCVPNDLAGFLSVYLPFYSARSGADCKQHRFQCGHQSNGRMTRLLHCLLPPLRWRKKSSRHS